MKRGISPLIATILLVAFVIILAALIIAWLGSLVDIKTEAIDEVTFIDMDITGVRYNGEKIQVQIKNNEFNTNIERLVIITTHPSGTTTDLIESPEYEEPVLPRLYTKWFDTTLNTCEENFKYEVEAIPKILKEDTIYTLTASADTYKADVDCSGGIILTYLKCDTDLLQCTEVPGNEQDECLTYYPDCEEEPPDPGEDECTINEVYWSNIPAINPNWDITAIEGETVYRNIETEDCNDEEELTVQIYECEDEDCTNSDQIESITTIIDSDIMSLDWIAPEPSKHYTFRAKAETDNGYFVPSSNILHTAPEGFLGACDLTITEDQGITRTEEPIILNYNDIEEKCPDIEGGTLSSIRIKEGVTEEEYQIDNWNEDNKFNLGDELLFVANVDESTSKTYTLEYSFIEKPPTNYRDIYDELSNDYWFDESRSDYWGRMGDIGELVFRQDLEGFADHSLINFLGTSSNYEIISNGPIRARIYSENSGNKGADFIADATYEIYPDKEVFVTSNVEWTSDCPERIEPYSDHLENCWYIRMGEINDGVQIEYASYEDKNNNVAWKWIGAAPSGFLGLPPQGPFEQTELWLGWFSLRTQIRPIGDSQAVDIYTTHLFNLDPTFDSIWGWSRSNNAGFDHTSFWQELDTNLQGKTRTITTWVSSRIIDQTEGDLQEKFRNEEKAYDNPLKTTIVPNGAEI